MTNFTANASGQVGFMKNNYRMVPEQLYWVWYESDPVRQIVYRKQTLETYVIHEIRSSGHTREEIRKFSTGVDVPTSYNRI